MAIQDDFNVDASGNIRQDVAFVPGTHTRYSTLALHAWLQDMADDATSTPDDYVDILDANPSELAGKRNTVRPMALSLLNGFNINDATAQWFKFGSVEQSSGDVLYTGLKVLGSLVANSPIYIYQNGAKVTKYWADSDASSFQILVKAKGSSGDTTLKDITVFSRKYGQTYSHFDVDLSPGGEQVAALATALDGNIDQTAGAAETIFGTITIGTAGGYTWDSGDGNGTKTYDGKITLNGTTTLKEAYNALMWACSENSTATINSVPGWRFRGLTGYAENGAAPFGQFAGGKFFLAQGWLIEGYMSADSKNFQLISNDGTTVTPPTSVTIEVTNVTTSDYVLVGRDNAGSLLTAEYTVSGTIGTPTVTATGNFAADTPTTGTIRISGNRYAYSSWTGATMTLAANLDQTYTGASAFVPFIDGVPTGSTITSAAMQFSSNFTARYRVRRGDAVSPIVPFESTIAVTSNGGSGTTVRNADA